MVTLKTQLLVGVRERTSTKGTRARGHVGRRRQTGRQAGGLDGDADWQMGRRLAECVPGPSGWTSARGHGREGEERHG